MSQVKELAEEDECKMDMTAMIDIVFNLVIFFMLVTDINQKDLAALTLPLAHMSQDDDGKDGDDRLIVNISQEGVILIKDQTKSLDALATFLEAAKRGYDARQALLGKEGSEEKAGQKVSKLFVLLRADKDTPWQHIQYIMTIMAEAKIYKLQFGTKKYLDGFYVNPDGSFKVPSEKQLGGKTKDEVLATTKG
ncbi:MAG: ExbD/TolR family protein [Planctomycetaceae bacterium]